MDKIKCKHCDGVGWYPGHDPSDFHIDGICTSCPIQVQCENCRGLGYIILNWRKE